MSRSQLNQILDKIYGFDPTPLTIDYPPKLDAIVIQKCLICNKLHCDCRQEIEVDNER